MTRIAALILIYLSTLLTLPHIVYAQSVTLENVLTITNKGYGPILEDNQVKGYYFLYEKSKESFFERNYSIRIYDQNMNFLFERDFTGSIKLYVAEVQYLAQKIYIKFGNVSKNGSFKKGCFLKIIHQNGDMEHLDLENDYAEQVIYSITHIVTPPKQSIIPFKNGDFIVTSQSKPNLPPLYSSNIRYYTNKNVEAKWHYKNSDSVSKSYSVKYLCKSETTAYFNLVTTKNSGVDVTLVAIDFKTGAVVYEAELEEKGFANIFDAYIDNDGNMLLTGTNRYNFYSLDFFRILVDKKGVVVDKKVASYNTLRGSIKSHLSDKQTHENKFSYDTRELICTANGGLYLVSEETNETKNNGIKYRNYIITEFNKNMEILHINSISKLPPQANLEANHDYYRTGDMKGNLTFVNLNKEDDNLYMGVIYNMGTNKKPSLHFTNVCYGKGKAKCEYIEIDPEATVYTAVQGKSGHVLLLEYYAERKKLHTRLEKLDVE